MKRPLLVADLFCGAGGTSTGARRALEAHGLAMRLVALNHWNVALETHRRNHPDAKHILVNIYNTKPREAVPGGRLDLLMASPTCTFWSRARGGKPISREQRFGRMTPTQVIRWCTELRVRVLLVENVPEFVFWGPIDRESGRPSRNKRGAYFRAWIRKLRRLGFHVQWSILNAADYGDATTRERFFLIARSDRRQIHWPLPTHSRDGAVDLYGAGGKRWRAAREIIDWSIPGKSIFSRKRPLSQKTLARIYAGAVKFRWPEPFLVILRQHMDVRSIHEPLPTICASGTHIGLAQPLIVRTAMHRSNSKCVRSAEEPIPTVTTDGGLGLVEPFVLPQHGGGVAREVSTPLPTITTDGAHALIAPYHGMSKARSVEAPLPTQTTRDRFGLVMPVTHDDDSQRARSIEEPIPTVTGAARGELAFIAAAFGERSGQTPRVHNIEEPTPTICAKGRVQLVEGVDQSFDILFRMLQPHELAAAMGFNDESRYEFAGTKTEITMQIGNAVPVNTAAALVGSIFSSHS